MAEPFSPYAGVEGAALTGGEGGDALHNLLVGILHGTVTLPKRVIEAAKATAPGLRREDFTDIPADAGGVFGLTGPKPWQPGDDLYKSAGETALMTAGATWAAPAVRAGEVALGAGPVRKAALPMDEASRMARAKEQGYDGPWYHGGGRMDRFTESGKINPKRATSGPMPYFTDDPAIASNYAKGKADTSMSDIDNVTNFFTVSPKDLGVGGRSPFSVEQSWHFLPPEAKRDILEKAKRVGYEKPSEATGPLTLHPPGVDASISGSQFDRYLAESRGNPLTALRKLWVDSGELVGSEAQLADIYRLSGYKAPISEVNAPWTEAKGVFPGMLRMRNPLQADNAQVMMEKVLPALEEAFKRDRTRGKPDYAGADSWDKNVRYTPRQWVEQAKADYAKGDNSFVWTSIPDKVTAELRRLGYDGVMDTGGKMGGQGHRVAIPFGPEQVRSKFAKFDPAKLGDPNLLAGGLMAAPVGFLASQLSREEQ